MWRCSGFSGAWTALLLLFLLLFIPASAPAEAETFVLRLHPLVTRQDRSLADGFVRVGGSATVQWTLEEEALTPAGRSVSLTGLLRSRDAEVLRVTWRFRAKELSGVSSAFLLRPQGDDSLTRRAELAEGWNLWDLTDLLQASLKKGRFPSLRLQAGEGAGAAFDLAGSQVCVCLSLPAEALSPGERLITDDPLLDAAFAALPLDHWALQQYQSLADAIVIPPWPETGVPYYFGGHSEEKVLRLFSPSQPSKYYKSSRTYLCGFDCSAFLRWAEERAGCLPLDQLDRIIGDRAGLFPASRRDVSGWMQVFRPGDLIVIDHGTYHVGMLIGTPRMYGMTAENAPELAAFLDAPLMIHCGEDPFVYDRFLEYIQSRSYRISVTPPDGGVTVSLLVNTPADAPHSRTAPWKKDYGYFLWQGQPITAYPLSACRRLAWLHPIAAE